jgi:hypothetical protein
MVLRQFYRLTPIVTCGLPLHTETASGLEISPDLLIPLGVNSMFG